jgi:hypothetical protein
MLVKWIGVVALLAGCDKLLGLTPPIYVPPDAPVQLVTGEYRYLYAVVDSTEHPAILDMPADADNEIDALLDDGTVLPIARAADGTFSFSTPLAARYRLVVRDSDQNTAIEYQSDLPQLYLRRRFYSRTNVPPATKYTPVSFDETPASTTLSSAIASYGVRTYLFNASVAKPLIDWSTTGLGMLSAAAHDRVQYQHWDVVGGAPYEVITEYDERSPEMHDGDTIAFTGTPAALKPDHCVHLKTHRLREQQRLQAATLNANTSGSSWVIDSTPLAALGAGAALPLAQQYPVTMSADDELDVVYGSPYPGEVDISNIQISSQRMLSRPTATVVLNLANSEQLVDLISPAAGPSCPNNIVDVGAMPPALMSSSSLAGTPLTDDKQVVSIDRSQLVPFEYTLGAGQSDLVYLTLYEVIVAIDGTTPITATVALRTFAATGSSPIEIDPNLLVRGHYYVLDVSTRVGLTGAPQFDFRTIAFPVMTANVYTSMFRIEN